MNDSNRSQEPISEFYEVYPEAERLSSPAGQLEFERTKDILTRYLPPPPAVVLDVGGGSGPYAFWLASLDYEVHLVEPSPKLLAQAAAAAAQQKHAPLASCQSGDARQLPCHDASADALLMLGPLYHLTEEGERRQALAEAHRALKPDGLLFAAAISRFASTLDSFSSGYFEDPQFRDIVRGDLASGQHRNPTDNLLYFTDAYFHLPHELRDEISRGSFEVLRLLPIEGMAVFARDLEELWSKNDTRQAVLEILRQTEDAEAILGATSHLMCVARRLAA
jgi:ubiquinone/menaquinone biosynthesis C-methylase UbiE